MGDTDRELSLKEVGGGVALPVIALLPCVRVTHSFDVQHPWVGLFVCDGQRLEGNGAIEDLAVTLEVFEVFEVEFLDTDAGDGGASLRELKAAAALVARRCAWRDKRDGELLILRGDIGAISVILPQHVVCFCEVGGFGGFEQRRGEGEASVEHVAHPQRANNALIGRAGA